MTPQHAGPSPKTTSGPQQSEPQRIEEQQDVGLPLLPQRVLEAPQTLRPADVQVLQRAIGNRAVAGLLQRSDHDAIRRKEQGQDQRAYGLEGGEVSADHARALRQAKGGGRPLGDGLRRTMESAFQTDFSQVRIHTDGQADSLNRTFNARAFTHGSDVFFRKGEFNPGSRDGRKMLAHELAHVVQQTHPISQKGGQGVQRKLRVGPAKDRYEEEADRLAEAVTKSAASTAVQRTPVSSHQVIQRNIGQWFKQKFDTVKSGAQQAMTTVSNTTTTVVNSQPVQQGLDLGKKAGKKVYRGGEIVFDEMSNKSTKIVGKEKKRSKWSRLEAEKTLDMPTEQRVAGIVEVFNSDMHPTNAFKRIAFLIEGKAAGGLETEYQKATGRGLRADITNYFTNRPHKHSATYLLSVLDNDGEAPLESRILLTLGLVDSPAVDEERLVELAERAPITQFKPIWTKHKELIRKKAGQKTFDRLQALMDIDAAEQVLEAAKQAGLTPTAAQTDALSAARDRQLAAMVQFRINKMSKALKYGIKAIKLVGRAVPALAAVPMLAQVLGTNVEAQKLAYDIIQWRKAATQDDVVYIRNKGGASAFRQALNQMPQANTMRMKDLRGVTQTEIEYFWNLATDDIPVNVSPQEKEAKIQASAVFQAVKLAKEMRGSGRAGRLAAKGRNKLRGMMGGPQWDKVAPQIEAMTPEEREALLNRYNPTNRALALQALTEDLNKVVGEDKVGPTLAVFENSYGEAGPGYLKLVDYVTKQVKMKSKLGRAKRAIRQPTKGGRNKKFGDKVIKLLGELRGSEYAQLRQNQALLQTIEEHSGDRWPTIMRILGITSSTDQLTGTKEQVIDQAQKTETRPEYWATLIEALAAKAKFDYAGRAKHLANPQPGTQVPGVPSGGLSANAQQGANIAQSSAQGTNAKTQPTGPSQTGGNKPVEIEKIKIEELMWHVLRAQAVARQVEEETNGQTTAAEFMRRIYDALQPETQQKLIESAQDSEKGEKYEKVFLALRDQANHPLEATEALNKTLKKAETVWYKRLWRPRPDRVKIFNSFNRLEGKDLLEQWSNFREFLGLHKGLQEVQEKQTDLQDQIDRYKTAATNTTDPEFQKAIQEELDRLYNQMIRLTAMGTAIQQEMSTFVLGIRPDRHEYLLKMTGLVSEDRLKLEAMLTEKIINAAESDPEVILAMAAANFPFGEWMKSKMRGVDAIEMQRYLDTTRQWHLFSNKGAQLDEGTRRVVGAIRSGNVDIREAEQQGKSQEELQGLKSKYSQKTEEELQDRKQVEAAFKDMQAKFNARASLIVRIITTILVTAISGAIAGATMGAATPLMIGVNAALLLGQIALHSAFDYFVLKKPISQVAIEAGVAILQTTLTLLSMNLATAMNASFLHPDLFLKGTEWIAPNLSKALSKTIVGILMAYPKTVLKMAYDQQPLEEVVEKGKEKTMGKEVLKNLAKGASKPWLRFVIKSAIGGAMYGVEEAKTPLYESLYGPHDPNAPPSQQPTQPTPQEMLQDPGRGVQHGIDQAGYTFKNFLTPKEKESPPTGDFATTFVSPETFDDNLQKMIAKQPRKLKKDAKKTMGGSKGDKDKNGWLIAEKHQRQQRMAMLGQNRERMLKGMKLVESNGTETKLSTGVTTLTPNVRIVYLSGWRLEDTGTPKTVQLNGQPVNGPALLHPGDFVTVGATRYRVQLGVS